MRGGSEVKEAPEVYPERWDRPETHDFKRYSRVLRAGRAGRKDLCGDHNLPPRKMMGIDSEGMLISAVYEYDGHEGLNLLMLDDSIPAGRSCIKSLQKTPKRRFFCGIVRQKYDKLNFLNGRKIMR